MRFRRNTIFHVEDSLPDPEEIKLRFRRRVLLVALAGFLLVLGAPVARELRPNLHARAEARRFAERMIETRTLAANARVPVSLELSSDRQSWEQIYYAPGDACATQAPGPSARYVSDGVSWKVQAQQADGHAATGHKLCFHPVKGLLLDTMPLDQDGKLLLSLSSPLEEGATEKELAAVLITQGGSELQTISY